MLLLFLLMTFLGTDGESEFLWKSICDADAEDAETACVVTLTFGDCLALEVPLTQLFAGLDKFCGCPSELFDSQPLTPTT